MNKALRQLSKEDWEIGLLIIYWLKKVDKLTRRKVLNTLKNEQTGNIRFINAIKTNIIVYASRNMEKKRIEKIVERALTLSFKVPVKIEVISFNDLKMIFNELLRTYKEIKSR